MGSWVTRIITLWWFLGISLVGCATMPPAQVPVDVPAAKCLPPGIADVPPTSALISADVVRTPYGPGWLIHYNVEDQHIDVVWVDGEPIAFDPNADDMAVAVWIRSQRAPCTWVSEIVGAQRI